MRAFIPHAVRMRKLGLVPDHDIRGYHFGESKWVAKGHTVRDVKKAYLARVDRVISAFEKFARICKSKISHREIYEQKMADYYAKRVLPKRRFAYDEASWADIVEEDDNLRASQRSAYEARLIAMPEAELIAYNANALAEIRAHRDDARSWNEFIREIRAKRALVQVKVAEAKQVWSELNVPGRAKAPAKKRVNKNAFSAFDDDSDSEPEGLTKEEMAKLENLLLG